MIEIDNAQKQLISLEQELQISDKVLGELEFKIKNTLATEALYSFIEKHCKSDDYRKHLGIVSIIRNNFDMLSELFMGSKLEAEQFRDKFDKPLQRIILYIDDLDRCPEERVFEVLGAVNLLMAFPLFIVVVGVDPRWVKNALFKKYYFQFSGQVDHEQQPEKIEASDYLEKIFQAPFHLNPAEDENVKTMIAELIKPGEAAEIRRRKRKAAADKSKQESNVGEAESAEEEEEAEAEIFGVEDDFETGDTTRESEYVVLSSKEIELLQDMSCVIGNNPRAIKRFVNIYQIIRAHQGFNYMKAEEDRELLTVMFWLALYNGKYKALVKSFLTYVNGDNNESKTLSSFLQPLDSAIGLRRELNIDLSNHPSYFILQNEVMATFAKHHEFVQRFTFDES